MKPDGNQIDLKKVSYESEKSSGKISKLNIKFLQHVLNTINISLIVLISILFFLSFDSQRKWSDTYKTLSKTRAINNNLVDYISKTEEFYINKFESLSTYRKTKPKDLIYFNRIEREKESLFKKYIKNFIEGIRDSRYQKGY